MLHCHPVGKLFYQLTGYICMRVAAQNTCFMMLFCIRQDFMPDILHTDQL